GVLQSLDVVEVDAVEYEPGGMQPAAFLPDLFIDQTVINLRRFPAHAAYQSDCLHAFSVRVDRRKVCITRGMQEKRQFGQVFSIGREVLLPPGDGPQHAMQEGLNFPDAASGEAGRLELAPGAWVLRNFASAAAPSLLDAIDGVLARSPLRHMVTPRGSRVSVRMSNCGDLGWISDRRGYRYAAVDPLSGEKWPPMPAGFADLASRAAGAAGFDGFR